MKNVETYGDMLEIIESGSVAEELIGCFSAIMGKVSSVENFRCNSSGMNAKKFLDTYIGRRYHLFSRGIEYVGLDETINVIKLLDSNDGLLMCSFSGATENYSFLFKESDYIGSPILVGSFSWTKSKNQKLETMEDRPQLK